MGRLNRKSVNCRQHQECIPCVRKGCMFPGIQPFPCRASWGDMEGDFPFNPPPRTVGDCLELTMFNPTTVLPSSTMIPPIKSGDGSSGTTYYCPILCVTAVVAGFLALLIYFFQKQYNGKRRHRRRRQLKTEETSLQGI